MPDTLTAESRIVASRDQVSTNLSGEVVILGLHDSTYYGLDPVGARIWALVQEPQTLNAVVDVLVAEYEVTRDQALTDLMALVASLIERGLVEIAPATAA
jgi:hypothetical protein